ncbi:sensor histidine kinase [Actinomadura scrupuli]|uniref:sensor histidine kinase n=1 Tax=Actinomadura scrupuli TaxID=559629 RepID=UPI003D95C0D3
MMGDSEPLDLPTARAPMSRRIRSLVAGLSPAVWRGIDALVAVGLFLGLTTPVLLGHPAHDDPQATIVLIGAGTALPLAVRRRRPVTVLAVIVAFTAVANVLGVPFTPFGSNASPSVGLAMYTVAERHDRRFSLKALAAVTGVLFGAVWIETYAHSPQVNAVHVVAAMAGWFVGDALRVRRTYLAELAAHRRREADERTWRALAEERLQISRDVHDVISHNLSVIAVRSGVGRMLFDEQPEEARAALSEVETVSRGALTELRRLLGAVRERQTPAPAPRLDDLPHLVEQVRASGTDVILVRRGTVVALPPTLEVSAYRIVQEALTNVVKHAGRTRARVVVEYGDEALLIEVTDAGNKDRLPLPAVEGEGWGVVGMRERAALFGGTVVAGPRDDGGFRVSARLPLGQATGEDGQR